MSARSVVWSGVVTMTPERYDAIAAALPTPLLERRAICVSLAECTGDDHAAIYIAVTASGHACYVGQANRQPDRRGAAARRAANHRAEPSKVTEWAGYWILPLPNETHQAHIDAAEVRVASMLGLPVRNRRWRRAQAAAYGVGLKDRRR
ncbi:MAG: hypothetical protein HOV67_20105 [Kribbellaceae bacterium]|nr:hypothetical protein [Kribbellaceae bacterium]